MCYFICSQKSCMSYKAPVVVEISPLVSYAGEDLDDYVQNKDFQPPVALLSPVEKVPREENPTIKMPLQVHVVKMVSNHH